MFASVITVGIPSHPTDTDEPHTIFISLGMMVAVLFYLTAVVVARPLYKSRLVMLAQQWAVLETDRAVRLNYFDECGAVRRNEKGTSEGEETPFLN